MDHFRISIIIVNWNGMDDTLECLKSISKLKYEKCDIIVVDNGSKDNSVKVINNKFPDVVVLENGKNLGFTGGNNVGIQYALKRKADFILLLNNDTIVDSKLINNLIKASTEIAGESILGAKIYYFHEPDKIWYAGGKWEKAKSCFVHIGQGSIDDGKKFNVIAETDYICGCALFISSEVLRKIGLLDELYFLTFEETDLCYRARKRGVRCYLVPDAKVWHKISTSFGGENSNLFHYYLMRNKLLWAEKNLSFPKRLSLYRNVIYDLSLFFIRNRFKNGLKRHFSSANLRLPSINKADNSVHQQYRAKRAQVFGVRDYILRRFGECSAKVRSLI